jgi:hypothetical protein
LACQDFKHNPDGTWTTVRRTVVKVGIVSMTLDLKNTFGPKGLSVGGVDIATALNEKCQK